MSSKFFSEFAPKHNFEPAPKLDHIAEIKLHIREMPYGDTMALAEAAGGGNSTAKLLWDWAHSEQ